jgi:hypothetical protein
VGALPREMTARIEAKMDIATQRWVLYSVLWIRIRKNLKVLAGSECKKKIRIRIPTDSDPDTVVEWKSSEKSQIKHLKEKKNHVFLLEHRFQNTYESN